jgi:hypothetical protein
MELPFDDLQRNGPPLDGTPLTGIPRMFSELI